MQATPLSLTARTLYVELHDLALALGLSESAARPPGSFVSKHLKGKDYIYYQYPDLRGGTRQCYVGPDDEATRSLIDTVARRQQQLQPDLARLDELRAAFVAAGGNVTDHGPLRVIRAFADAGILQPGLGRAVLIGTHAFNALGNLLGVRWASYIQTQDIDLAGETDIDLAVRRPETPAPDVLEQLGMGFIPVPAFDPRSPSTSFRVRGQTLRVDLLAPETGRPSRKPVFVPALNAVAQPLRFLDYLLAEIVPVVVVGRSTQVLANVPTPERFALHKLLVAQYRPAVEAGKAEKDRMQGLQLLEVLMNEAPDGVAEAKAELIARGKGWADKMQRTLMRSRQAYPDVVAWLHEL